MDINESARFIISQPTGPEHKELFARCSAAVSDWTLGSVAQLLVKRGVCTHSDGLLIAEALSSIDNSTPETNEQTTRAIVKRLQSLGEQVTQSVHIVFGEILQRDTDSPPLTGLLQAYMQSHDSHGDDRPVE